MRGTNTSDALIKGRILELIFNNITFWTLVLCSTFHIMDDSEYEAEERNLREIIQFISQKLFSEIH